MLVEFRLEIVSDNWPRWEWAFASFTVHLCNSRKWKGNFCMPLSLRSRNLSRRRYSRDCNGHDKRRRSARMMQQEEGRLKNPLTRDLSFFISWGGGGGQNDEQLAERKKRKIIESVTFHGETKKMIRQKRQIHYFQEIFRLIDNKTVKKHISLIHSCYVIKTFFIWNWKRNT